MKETNMQPNMKLDMQSNTKSDVQSNMKSNMKSNTKSDVQSNTKSDVQSNVQSKIQVGIQSNVQSTLISTIFLSEKRKNLLLFLADGPKSSGEIKEAFDFPWKSMIPQIKQLLKTGLVTKEYDIYRLSGMGPVIVENMKHLLGTLDIYEENLEYWKNHDLNSLPPFLRERIYELESCKVFPFKNENILLHTGFLNKILASKRVLFLTSTFYPEIPFLYSELMGRGADTTIVINETAIKSMKEELLENKNSLNLKNPYFDMLFDSYREEADKFLSPENPDLYIYPEDKMPPAVLVTESLFLMMLCGKDGGMPNKGLCSSEQGALNWGEELIRYYKSNSEQPEF